MRSLTAHSSQKVLYTLLVADQSLGVSQRRVELDGSLQQILRRLHARVGVSGGRKSALPTTFHPTSVSCLAIVRFSAH